MTPHHPRAIRDALSDHLRSQARWRETVRARFPTDERNRNCELALDSFSEFVKLLPVDDARLEALVEATAFNGCMFSPAADGQANRFISRYGYDLLRFTGKPANGEDHDSALTELVVLCQSDDDELIAEALSELEGAS